MRSRFAALCALLPLLSFYALPALAAQTSETSQPQTQQPEQSQQPASLDQVVVTPTMTARTVDQSLTSVTVIDHQQLRTLQPQDITDVLRGQPGIDITSNGSFGKVTSLYVRGTGSNSTLLLLDGVRLRSVTAGLPSWQYLPASLFDRAEIVRGPRASLYGADALGGVVQLFTPDGSHPGTWLEAGAGNLNTHHFSAGTEGEKDGTRYGLAFDRFDTDGSELRSHSEPRGYDNTSGTLNVTHRFANNAEIGVFGFRAEGNSEFEGFTPDIDDNTDYAVQVAGIHGQLWLTDNWLSKLQISDARDDSTNYSNGVRGDTFNTRSRSASWQNQLLFGDQQLVVGGDFRRDTVDSTQDYDEDQRDNAAGFAQLLLNFGALDVQGSLRHDHNEAFGDKTTGGLALGYKLTPHYRLRASYATAFRAPTFNDLYYPGYGNDQLDPEKSKSTELGLRGQYQVWFWDLALYQTDVDDLIAYAVRNGRGAPYNVNSARIRGAELSAGLKLDQWRLAAALTAQDPRDRDTDNVLQARSQRSLRLDADRQFGDFSLGGTWLLKGHRYNDAANQQRLGGYGLLDLRAAWTFAPHWSTRLSVRNVFDKRYATARDFAGWDYLNAGRTVMLSLRYDTH